MAVMLSRFIGKISSSNRVEVTITGTGDNKGCYATINGTRYISATTGIEVMTGEVIIFCVSGTLTHPGTLEINGNAVLSVGESEYIKSKTYKWTVPDRITSVSIKLSTNPYFGRSSITVTTA